MGGFQTGELESALGVTMTAVKISAPVPPSVANDTAWEDFLETAANDTETTEVSELRKPTKLVVEWNKTRQQEGVTFPTKIIIKFVDDAVCLRLSNCWIDDDVIWKCCLASSGRSVIIMRMLNFFIYPTICRLI